MKITFEITPEDRVEMDVRGDARYLALVSQEIMVTNAGGQAEQFTPVRVQSCMNPGNVRIEPVVVKISQEGIIHLKMLGKAMTFPENQVRLLFKPWKAQKLSSHCTDCTKCRRCWA